MSKIVYFFIAFTALFIIGCKPSASTGGTSGNDSLFHYAKHISIEKQDGYTLVKLADPWKTGRTLHTYIVVDHKDSARMSGKLPKGTVVYTPLRRAVVFTAAHANLFEMLHDGQAIAGVADVQYMHIPDIQRRLVSSPHQASPKGRMSDYQTNLGDQKPPLGGGLAGILDVGNSMKPDIEKIISIKADAIFLSPFENSGGYGRLEEIGIPIIECADYMETGALGRAEWMKFYGLLMGREEEADSLFGVVEKNYNALKDKASHAKQTLSVLPDRKTGSVWYVPGGQSSTGMLYKDAGGKYAFSNDTHTGSLALPFETILDKMGNADFWILSYNGSMDKQQLLAEYRGYAALKPFKTGRIYGCPVDTVPYFEEVSWRPDWLLGDLIQLFHPDLNQGKLRYYKKI